MHPGQEERRLDYIYLAHEGGHLLHRLNAQLAHAHLDIFHVPLALGLDQDLIKLFDGITHLHIEFGITPQDQGLDDFALTEATEAQLIGAGRHTQRKIARLIGISPDA